MLRFEPAEHRYFVDGCEYPGVTQILKDEGFSDYSQLDSRPARNPMFVNRADEVTYRGRWVHAACALLLQDRLRWQSLSSAPAWQPYVESCEAWRRELKPAVLLVEQPFFNPENGGYCGTIDLVAIIQDWRVVLDLKTGEPDVWHRLQTGAYRRGLYHLPEDTYPFKRQPHRRAGLYLRANGSAARMVWHDDMRDMQFFSSIVGTWHARRALQCQ